MYLILEICGHSDNPVKSALERSFYRLIPSIGIDVWLLSPDTIPGFLGYWCVMLCWLTHSMVTLTNLQLDPDTSDIANDANHRFCMWSITNDAKSFFCVRSITNGAEHMFGVNCLNLFRDQLLQYKLTVDKIRQDIMKFSSSSSSLLTYTCIRYKQHGSVSVIWEIKVNAKSVFADGSRHHGWFLSPWVQITGTITVHRGAKVLCTDSDMVKMQDRLCYQVDY